MLTLGVAIPCYRPHVPALIHLLLSLNQQTRKPDQVAISCSSSSPAETKLISEVKCDFPITLLITSEKQNAAKNRNLAMAALDTDIITFFDADDVMHPQRLDILLQMFNLYSCDLLLHSCIINDTEKFKEIDIKNMPRFINELCRAPTGCATFKQHHRGLITHGHVTVSRKFMQQYQLQYREDKKHEGYNEDSIFCGDALLLGPNNIFLPDKLSRYYQSGNVPIPSSSLFSPEGEKREEEKGKEQVPLIIFTLWTGDNPMEENRKTALKQMSRVTSMPVTLVTPENLIRWVHCKTPIHPAYRYLSAVHRADYLRCYLMHHYGGGYADIKMQGGNWQQCYHLLNSGDLYAVGYRELPGGIASVTDKSVTEAMNNQYYKLIGMCAFIFRPNTPLTMEWITELHRVLDEKLPLLQVNPAKHPRDAKGHLVNGTISNYPIAWSEILGQILQPLLYKYQSKLLQILPTPRFE